LFMNDKILIKGELLGVSQELMDDVRIADGCHQVPHCVV